MSTSILFACLVAGPAFLTSTVLASHYLELPRPIVVAPEEVGTFLIMLIPALLVGFFLALVPVVIGTAALRSLGNDSLRFRSPWLWTATGAVTGATLALLLGLATVGQHFAFGLVVTSALCGLVSRKFTSWED